MTPLTWPRAARHAQRTPTRLRAYVLALPPTRTRSCRCAHRHARVLARLRAHLPTTCVTRGHASGAPNTYVCPPKSFMRAHPKRVHEENHRGGWLGMAPTRICVLANAGTPAARTPNGRPLSPHVYAHELSWARDFSRVTGSMCSSTCSCAHTCTPLDTHTWPSLHVAGQFSWDATPNHVAAQKPLVGLH